jgi:hypothetical protein
MPQFSTPSIDLGANAASNLLLYSFIDPPCREGKGVLILEGADRVCGEGGLAGATRGCLSIGFSACFLSVIF